MSEGYIHIHRKFIHWEWFTDAVMVQLWVYFLCKAMFKDVCWKGIELKRGEFVTSYSIISKDTGLSVQQIRTCMGRLIKAENLTSRTTNRYTIVTINKYDEYQGLIESVQQADQQTSNKQATSKQQASNKQKNNDNNDNNINNISTYTPAYACKSLEDEKAYLLSCQLWLEDVSMKRGIKPNELQPLIQRFFSSNQERGITVHENERDLKTHFINWLDKMKEKADKETKRETRIKKNDADMERERAEQRSNSHEAYVQAERRKMVVTNPEAQGLSSVARILKKNYKLHES